MAKRLILGKKGSDFGLFVSEPGTDVGSITNVKDFAFTTSDSAYKGNFLYQKNVNENDPTSNAVTGTLSNDSNNVTSNPGNTIFVALLGMPHGLLFIAYLILACILKNTKNWNFKDFSIVILASILPFGAFYVDWKYFKTPL